MWQIPTEQTNITTNSDLLLTPRQNNFPQPVFPQRRSTVRLCRLPLCPVKYNIFTSIFMTSIFIALLIFSSDRRERVFDASVFRHETILEMWMANVGSKSFCLPSFFSPLRPRYKAKKKSVPRSSKVARLAVCYAGPSKRALASHWTLCFPPLSQRSCNTVVVRCRAYLRTRSSCEVPQSGCTSF